MKRLLALIAILAVVAVPIAGCGSTHHASAQSVAAAHCAQYKAQGQTFAKHYLAGLPAASQKWEKRLAQSSYKAAALSHGYRCQ